MLTGQEDRGCGCAFKPQCMQDLLYWMSHLSVLVLLLKASLSIIILSELIFSSTNSFSVKEII